MNSTKPISAADMVLRVFDTIEKQTFEKANELFVTWRSVVSKVHGYGEKLAAHTKLVDLKNGTLLVETDHPGWIQILQLYSDFILTGLRRNYSGSSIQSLAFRLEGNNASLYDVDYDALLKAGQEKIVQKLDADEAAARNRFPHESSAHEEPLPPELADKFERMKKNVLTNTKK
ncbi:MAG: DUF721 domain-containing protein [Treponema sp.]|nr:DUF721 domain-containing protein [Treponema sp.]